MYGITVATPGKLSYIESLHKHPLGFPEGIDGEYYII